MPIGSIDRNLVPLRNSAFRKHLAISTALASVALFGYGNRSADAGSCASLAQGVYECSGPAGADVTQSLMGTPLAVSTTAGFGIDTQINGGNAFTFNGTGGLTFTDSFGSNITGGASGIEANNSGNGKLNITTTGQVTAADGVGIHSTNSQYGTSLAISATSIVGTDYGIEANNYGSEALTITTTGLIKSTGPGDRYTGNNYYKGNGINADNHGTDLTISAVDVHSYFNGIYARNFGSGVLSVTTTGQITGGDGFRYVIGAGINARNRGTDLSINVVDVYNSLVGIDANNFGSGALTITSTGHVKADFRTAIYASNRNTGTDLTVDVVDVSAGLSNSRSGGGAGIVASNSGSGELSITATGQITVGVGGGGISATNSGTDLTISAQGISVGRGYASYEPGIFASNSGSGNLSITTTGEVTAFFGGIRARNSNGGALSITATSAVTTTYGEGIFASNAGTALTVSVGDVIGRYNGIYAVNTGTDLRDESKSATAAAVSMGLVSGIGGAVSLVRWTEPLQPA